MMLRQNCLQPQDSEAGKHLLSCGSSPQTARHIMHTERMMMTPVQSMLMRLSQLV